MFRLADTGPGKRREPSNLQLRITTHAKRGTGRSVVSMAGELDLASAPKLKAALAAALVQPGIELVILDLAGLAFLDAAGLRTILEGARRASAEGRRLVVVPPSAELRRIFELTGVDAQLEWSERWAA